MRYIINPYMHTFQTGVTYPNQYSMSYVRVADGPLVERLYVSAQTNSIHTTLTDTTPNFAITGWFKLSGATGTTRTIFSQYEDFTGRDRCLYIMVNASNQIEILGYYTPTAGAYAVYKTTTQTFTSGSGWVHFAFVYDNTQTTLNTIAPLYVNGVLVTAYTINSGSTTNKFFYNQVTEAFRGYPSIGCYYAGGTALNPANGFNGYLDEITFWDKSLSSAEVTEIYNNGDAYDISSMSSYAANCLAWWRMGDYTSDNWDGVKWNIVNVKGDTVLDMKSVNLAQADRVTDAP